MRFRSNRMKEGYIYISSGSQPWRRLRFLMSSLRLRPSYQTWMTIEPHYLVMTGSKIVEPFRNVNVWNLDSNLEQLCFCNRKGGFSLLSMSNRQRLL